MMTPEQRYLFDVRGHLAPETLELIAHADLSHTKEIVKKDVVKLV